MPFQVANGSFNGTFLRAAATGKRISLRGFESQNLDTVWVVAAGATTSKIVAENDTGMSTVANYAGSAANIATTTVTITPVKGDTHAGTFQRPFGLVPIYSDTEAAGTAGTKSASHSCRRKRSPSRTRRRPSASRAPRSRSSARTRA